MTTTGEPLATGHLLDGRYRVEKVIGVGGMGRVYMANDTRLANRPVAVKEMLVGEGLHERKAVEDFAREAAVLAPLSHPGIPNLIDYFAEGGRHYLVMEYIAGGDLQGWLDKQGPKFQVPEPQVLRWGRAILDVLSFLHAQQPPIVYRDLKPGNIMINKDGHAMLIDFGIARFLPPSGRGTQIGSVGYAPPEQYLGKLEPRSDLYSLAATMHHLLTGRDPQMEPPFSFPPVRQLAPAVSVATERAVMMALELDAAKRPSSAAEMIAMLPNPEPEGAVGIVHNHVVANPSLANLKTAVLNKLAPATPAVTAPPSAPTASTPVVSPTAKTADLKGRIAARPAVAPAPPQRPAVVAHKPPTQSAPAPKPWPQRPAIAPGAAVNGKQGARPVVAVATGPAPDGMAKPACGASLIGVSEARRFALTGMQAIVGRHTGPADRVDIDLGVLSRGSERISRRHAEIIKRGDNYFIRDLGSLNGTFIVGVGRLGRDQLYPLKDRDQVAFGSVTFEFRKDVK
ncbi:MAG TPA: protein kinase [Candidatus Binataceae bacterium]|nr:protein kinase [Candidatus Binataceae bacterium]